MAGAHSSSSESAFSHELVRQLEDDAGLQSVMGLDVEWLVDVEEQLARDSHLPFHGGTALSHVQLVAA